jgi:hypothetical protein
MSTPEDHEEQYRKAFPNGLIKSWKVGTDKELAAMSEAELENLHRREYEKEPDSAKCRRIEREMTRKQVRSQICATWGVAVFGAVIAVVAIIASLCKK